MLTRGLLSNKPEGMEPSKPVQPWNVKRNPYVLTNVQLSNKPDGIDVRDVQFKNA